jgi:hypothetical protein
VDQPSREQRPPVFNVYDEDGVIHLVLGHTDTIDPWVMKEILRALHRVDPVGGAPVMVEQHDVVRMTPDAKFFLARICEQHIRPVAYMAYDLPERIQGEFFLRFHKPRFPFRVFNAHDEALKWFGQFTSAHSVQD